MSKITVNDSEISNSQIGDKNVNIVVRNPISQESKKPKEGFMHNIKFCIEIAVGVGTLIGMIWGLFTWIK